MKCQLKSIVPSCLFQVNVWDHVLPEKDIKAIADCEDDLQGNYVSWNVGWHLYNVEEFSVSSDYFCNQERGSTFFWFSDVPYTTSYYLCEALGTHLPLPKTMKESKEWFQRAERAWGNETRCSRELLLSVNDLANEGVWVRHYDGSRVDFSEVAWMDGEPNGLVYENCAQVENYKQIGVADIDCMTRIQCAVCEFKDQVVYSLLGTCENELRNINFMSIQDDLNQLRFRGYGEYSISLIDGVWSWMNEITQEVIATMDPAIPNFPMGRRIWNINRKICTQVEGK